MVAHHPCEKEQGKTGNVPDNRVRAFCFQIIHNPKFDIAIMSCIMMNILIMAMGFYDQPSVRAQLQARPWLDPGLKAPGFKF